MPHDVIITKGASVCAMLMLAACGGSSNSNDLVSDRPGHFENGLAELEDELAQQVTIQYFSDPADVLLSGSAVFNGVVSGLVSGEDIQPISIFGDLMIETDFSNGSQSITGSADDFVTSDGDPLSGQLQIIDGTLDDQVNPNADHTVSADLVGTIVSDDDGELEFSLNLEGDFYGADATLIAGGANGIVRQNFESLNFSGRFVASSSLTQ